MRRPYASLKDKIESAQPLEKSRYARQSAMMYETFSEFLVRLSGQGALWAVSVILAMAVTAVALYFFWDLVGRGVSLVRPSGRDRNTSGGGRTAQGH